MLDKSALIPALRARVKKLPIGHAIDLRTYKRDRSLVIVKLEAEKFLIVEDGFEKNEYRVEMGGLWKMLKTLLQREFPRSNKVRLYQLAEYRSTR